MRRHYVFADESGNFDFSRQRGATPYFAVGTVHVVGDDAVEALRLDLLRLQTDLGWRRLTGSGGFHASEDPQAVRDEVFAVLARHQLRLDVTLLEKSKAQPHLRRTDLTFFGYAWARHFDGLAPRLVAEQADDLMVVAAAVGTRRLRGAFRGAIEDVVRKAVPEREPTVLFMPSDADPALQAADYLLWAVLRSWTLGDDRALAPVRGQVRSQRDVFAAGRIDYY